MIPLATPRSARLRFERGAVWQAQGGALRIRIDWLLKLLKCMLPWQAVVVLWQ